MDNEIWLQRWKEKNTAWHEIEVNQYLLNNYQQLNLKEGSRVFIPLCGKTVDIGWFLSNGYKVVGVELSEVAIVELFVNLGLEPHITQIDSFKVYSAQGITIFEGDIFNLTKELIGGVDAVYDRAALVALPFELRKRYTSLLRSITNNAKQLLITVLYEKAEQTKPPFSINKEEIELHYKEFYTIKKTDSKLMSDGLKGVKVAYDEVWLLS